MYYKAKLLIATICILFREFFYVKDSLEFGYDGN
jgi:hypothetical protein